MRALLIEPIHSERRFGVREIELRTRPGGREPDYAHMAELLGGGFPERIQPASRTLADHGVYCDDNFRSKDHEGYLQCPAFYPLPLAGELLICGEHFDRMDGRTIRSASVSLMTVAALVQERWIDRHEAREIFAEAERVMEREHPDSQILRGAFPR